MSAAPCPSISLSVPAQAVYARPVRMFAASLASVGGLGVDEVEDLRMVVEEGFVYACATGPEAVDVTFTVCEDSVRVDYSLGPNDAREAEDASIEYAELLLVSLCETFEVNANARVLHLSQAVGNAS